MLNKKASTLLVENVIFIILNLIFLSILILFLIKQGSGVVVMEEIYSKQIALTLDSAKPGMIIKMDMEKGRKLSEKNEVPFGEIVTIEDNVVSVKLSEQKGKDYSFFNDVEVSTYPDTLNKNMYVFVVN